MGRLPQPDAASFRRLLASAGALLIVLPWAAYLVALKETAVLEISRAELAGLTDVASRTLVDRQELASVLPGRIFVAAVIASVAGVVLLLYAAAGLRRRESIEDDHTRHEIARLKGEITSQTKSEIADKATEEAVSQLNPVATEPSEAGGASASAEGGALTELVAPPQPTLTTANLRDRIVEIELQVLKRLEEIVGDLYVLRPRVKIVGKEEPHRSVRIDALLEGARSDLVVEIKVIARARSAVGNARNYANELIATTTRYQRATGRAASGWMIMLLDPGGDWEADVILQRYEMELDDRSNITVIAADQISDLQLPIR